MATAPVSADAPEPRTRGELIWAAVKLPIYSVALAPICVGSAAAYAATGGAVDRGRIAGVVASSVAVIAWLNLSNDGHDADTGVDAGGAKPESVVNLFGGASTVLRVAYALLALGCAGLLRAAVSAGDARIAMLLAAAIACGYVYQCPPFRWSYKGVGEPLCFAAFGPLATSAFYLCAVAGHEPTLVLPPVTAAAGAAAAMVGMTTTAILLCSHFHQREGDMAAGKKSPVVRLGTATAADVLTSGTLLAHSVAVGACAAGVLPWAAAAAVAACAPLAFNMVRFVRRHHDAPEVVFRAKFLAVRWHVAMAVCLSLALALG